MNQPKESNWRNWSDHPVIVGISVTAAILTLILSVWGIIRVRDSHNLSVEVEAVNKSPKELVDWYCSIKEDLERKRQAKALYYGRKITVSGKPDIFAVYDNFFSFKLPQFIGHVDLKNIPVAGVRENNVFVFVCRIEKIDENFVFGEDCRIERY